MGSVLDFGRCLVACLVALLLAVGVAAPACAADEARIVVRRFKVVGNTILSREALRRTFQSFVGKPLALRDLKLAARKLRAAYRERGYVMAYAYVPPQEFLDDTVEIRVQQGKYGKVKVDGNRYYSDGFIRRFFGPALRSQYVLGSHMEHALLVLNQFPDLHVQSVLEAKKNGTVDVTLKAKDAWPVHFTLDYDNFGARLVGRNRAGAGVAWGNAITEGDLLSLKATYPFEVSGAQPFLFGSYSIPVGHQGTRVEASYAHAKTLVGEELALLGIEGNADIGSVRVSVNDRLDLRHAEVWYYELVAKGVTNTALNGKVAVSDDEVRTVGIGHRGSVASKDGAFQYAHNYEVISGLGPLLGGSSGADKTSRVGADDGFVRVTIEGVGTYRVNKDLFILMRLSGQLATTGLMVPEQYALGGPDNVRGYQQGEFLGDNGYACSAELRQTVNQGRRSQVQLVLFVDHGGAALNKPLGGETANRDLTGAGLGLRAQLGPQLTLRMDEGFCVDPTFNLDKDKSKLNVQASYRF